MKNTILIIVFILIIAGIGNSFQEVRDRAFIQSIAVQTDSNNVYTSVKLYGDTLTYMGIGNDIKTSLLSAETRQSNAFFTGHTELIIFNEESFSNEILLDMLKNNNISPNCAVVISNGDIEDTETAYNILKTYDRIGDVSLKTVSEVIKEIQTNGSVQIPLLSRNLTYTTIEISI